ncbi:BglG family transcription antiterminator [Trichococcus ilyis]|uniref:Phosphotransferase system eiib component type 2/3 n=1 Tax=Trichococcus ilyis TaxID=640938 RepID=A0A143YSZ3_9LACT|nr:BglG family transcription antiterminator [Trichococcus ilyis]CZQ96349.1 phosphotransferase system eiib component type 2/3 [Trichococcus ilyis]SEJ78976.1 Transcriptional antiterminator [Trichococcus ilyis]
MLTKRQKKILDLMIHQNDFQTVDYFSKKLGVSKRTIHSEIKIIEDYVKSSGEYIEKRRGVGIALRKVNEEIDPMEMDEEADVYSTISRRIEIMKYLLFDEKVSFSSLSNHFMVSKTSIKNDLTFVMKVLSEGNNCKLQGDINGTRLIGAEEDIQKAFLQFNRYVLSNSDYYIEDEITKKMKLLEVYYGEQPISVCSNILYNYVRNHANVISDYYVQNVLNIFVILMYRIKMGHHISVTTAVNHSGEDAFFEESANELLNKAALRLDLSYTPEDVKYLSHHLILNRFESLPEQKIDVLIVDSLLDRVSESLNINFSGDEKLGSQLRNHIPPMIYRLRAKNKIENPFTSRIKTEFSLTFNVIWVVLSEYEKELGITFNEDEIAFLTIYFQAAIERAKANRRILVVCQMGIATSELLINRIKNVLPSLDTLEAASVMELDEIDLHSFDLILSTINIDLPNKKVIYVSPFLNDEDLSKIGSELYKPTKQVVERPFSGFDNLTKYIDAEFTYLNTNFTSKEELIAGIGKKLIQAEYITQEFIESVSNRETAGGTDLPTGVAVPHGNSHYVNRTVVAVIKNAKKFKWKNYYVDVVFMICISKQDTKETRNILADIYNIIDGPERLKGIRRASSTDDLLKGFRSEVYGTNAGEG